MGPALAVPELRGLLLPPQNGQAIFAPVGTLGSAKHPLAKKVVVFQGLGALGIGLADPPETLEKVAFIPAKS